MMDRKVSQGMQGWSDRSLEKCGKFFPPRNSSSSDKLSFYSRGGGFACVEVDSSNYAIPSRDTVSRWVSSVPKDFVFHFKAFGALCKNPTDVKCFPHYIQPQLSKDSGNVIITDLHYDVQRSLWKHFNESLRPAYDAGKLGLIVFQFNLAFLPSAESIAYLRYISEEVHPSYRIGIDFRSRRWIDSGTLDSTVSFLGTLRCGGVCLVASDDLEHEL